MGAVAVGFEVFAEEPADDLGLADAAIAQDEHFGIAHGL